MALVVVLQEDEDVLNVYRNLKIFCEMAPWSIFLATPKGSIVILPHLSAPVGSPSHGFARLRN